MKRAFPIAKSCYVLILGACFICAPWQALAFLAPDVVEAAHIVAGLKKAPSTEALKRAEALAHSSHEPHTSRWAPRTGRLSGLYSSV